MKQRKGLGRGLDILMPSTPTHVSDDGEFETSNPPSYESARDNEPVRDGEERVVMLDLGDIDPNPNQPRRRFDQAQLKELADSIRHIGVLQPILVCPRGGRYRIVAGERRWRAARMAELAEIPAIVRDLDRITAMEAALVENLQREGLNAIEEAKGIKDLMEDCGLTQDAVAQRLGRSRPAVANLLRLLSLPEAVMEMVRDGRLSAGHARALVGIDDPKRVEMLAQRAITEGWSVRQMEQAAQTPQQVVETRQTMTTIRKQPPEFGELEDRLRKTFGLRAQINGTLEKGKITLQYASREELERLYDMIGDR